MSSAPRLLLLLAFASPLPAQAPVAQVPGPAQPPQQPPHKETVGMPGRIDSLVLPGSELEPVPADQKSLVVLRIDAVNKHGTAHRYDLVFTGMVAGKYDLRTFLRRKDGTGTDDLPAIPIEVTTVLPKDQFEPNALEPEAAPWLGGYRLLLWLLGGVWIVGLLLILFVARRKQAGFAAPVRPLTLADRLRPIVAEAMQGRLPDARRAELERLLLGFWRRRLGLEQRPAAAAIPALRAHEQAGALLRQLELWLHAPPGREQVDVAALLAPYENLPAEEDVA